MILPIRVYNIIYEDRLIQKQIQELLYDPIKYMPQTKKFLEICFINIERMRKLNGNMGDCSPLF